MKITTEELADLHAAKFHPAEYSDRFRAVCERHGLDPGKTMIAGEDGEITDLRPAPDKD